MSADLVPDTVKSCDPWGINRARAVAAVELLQKLDVDPDVIEQARLYCWRTKDGLVHRYPDGLTPGPALNKAMRLVGENFEALTERAKELCGYAEQLEAKSRA